MRRWFLPDMPDLLELLREQATETRTGIGHFARWSHGAADAEGAVRAAEHSADDAKRAVQTALRSAFSTPLDPEDIYELSERLDSVMNAAKDIVREADVIAMGPDDPMGALADHIVTGVHRLHDAFDALGRDDDAATAASDAAVRACRDVERSYRTAMSDLLDNDNLREVMGRRELYRRYSRMADAVEQVAARIWYAVVKTP